MWSVEPVEPRSSQAPSLLSLAHELHLQIFRHLDPLDVLWLGQTCRDLRASVSDEGHWRGVLRSICRENDLFEPSLPADTMNLLELQRAVLGPTRWRSKIHLHAKMGPNFPLTYEKRSFATGSRKFSRVHLLAGGRYLVSLARQSNWFITLWDLGIPTLSRRSECTPEAISTLTIESEVEVRDICEPVHYSSLVRFTASITASGLSQQATGTCRVYEIGPLPEDADIREMRDIPVHFTTWEASCPMVNWDHVAIHSNTVDVWDVSPNGNAPRLLRNQPPEAEVASPVSQKKGLLPDCPFVKVLVFNNHLVAIDKYRANVSLWPMKGQESAQLPHTSDSALPSSVLQAPYPGGPYRRSNDGVRIPPPAIIRRSQSSFTYDLVEYHRHRSGDTSTALLRYKLDLPPLPDGVPQLTVVGQHTLPVPQEQILGESISRAIYSSGHLFMVICPTWRQGILGIISIPVTSIDDPSAWVFVPIESTPKTHPGYSRSSMCASTGRLVDVGEDLHSIWIFDFLLS